MLARFFTILLLCLFSAPLFALTPTRLTVDGMANPTGVDHGSPSFAWIHSDEGIRGQAQSAYQIRVAASPQLLEAEGPFLWDSGRVKSSKQGAISYRGKTLHSFQRVFWKLRVWDQNDQAGNWSEPAEWTMGVLGPADWHASWISDSRLLQLQRKSLGYHSALAHSDKQPKWVCIDLGAKKEIERVTLDALRHSVASGLGFPLRFRIEISDTEDFQASNCLLDQSQSDFGNLWATTITAEAKGASGRFVRVYVNRMRTEDDGSCRFALSQLRVYSGGSNIAVGAKVTAADSIENERWSRQSLTDGLSPVRDPELANSTLRLRKDFQVKAGLQRALLFSCGLGHYEAQVNGSSISDELFSTAWTNYTRECLYDSHEVTNLLREGTNATSFVLAGGFFNIQPGRYTKLTTEFRPLTLIAMLRLEYADGTVDYVGTDESWQVQQGPIVFSNLYSGEDYDARLESTAWQKPGFPSRTWRKAVSTLGPGGELKGASESAPPIRIQEVLQTASPTKPKNATLVYDLKQNASIVPEIGVRGAAGSKVKIRPAELLKADGTVSQSSVLHGGESYCTYTLSGKGDEIWRPRFFYHGARYLQLELESPAGAPLPTVLSVQGLVVHSDSRAIGDFECSNERFNRIRTLVRWAQRSNSFHVFTDCPHRERLGWIEQYYLNGPSLRYEFDYARLFRKGLNDMAASQTAQGLIPSINPEFVQFRGGFRDSPEWGAAFIIAAWQQYEWTGDKAHLLKHYAGMCRYLEYLQSKAQTNILSHGLGDWYDLGPKRPGLAQLTPISLTATALYFDCADKLSRIAGVLGLEEESASFEMLAAAIRSSFNTQFLNVDTDSYGTGSQTSNALPLALGLVPQQVQEEVLENLIKDIERQGDRFTAGDVGYRYVLRALAEAGRSDIISRITNQSSKPGYGFQLAQGCTSLAESWTAEPNSSQNHFMLGQIMEWFYGDLVGLRPDSERPGFALLHVAPAPVPGLTWARASFDSPRGLIQCEWHHEGTSFTLDLSIPPNCTALVRIPRDSHEPISESDRPAETQVGVSALTSEPEFELFTVTSGKYRFKTKLSR